MKYEIIQCRYPDEILLNCTSFGTHSCDVPLHLGEHIVLETKGECGHYRIDHIIHQQDWLPRVYVLKDKI